MEVEQGFECLITKPTRIEKRGIIITESLIDVLLTNRPDSFQLSGNYHPWIFAENKSQQTKGHHI